MVDILSNISIWYVNAIKRVAFLHVRQIGMFSDLSIRSQSQVSMTDDIKSNIDLIMSN